MFGLRVPLTKTLTSPDFDSVNSIICSSVLREPSQWLSKVNEKGQIFELQLENSSGDVGEHESLTDADCLCTCSDCATDDTGYGTDSDLHVYPGSNSKADELVEADYLQNQNFILDLNEIDDVFCGDGVGLSDSNLGVSHNSNNAEENIDSLFASVNSNQQSCDLFDSLSLENEFTLPDNIDRFFDTSAKNKSKRNDLVFNFGIEPDIAMMPHIDGRNNLNNDDIPPLPSKSKSATNSKKCRCSAKKVNSQRNDRHVSEHNICSVVVRLKSTQLNEPCSNTVELCERVIGIVPGHFGSSQSSKHRRQDKRVKIRAVVPTGIAARYPDIRVGDCLLSINDQEVTWDNLDSVLQVLLLQKQAKLTVHQISHQNDGSLVLKRKTQSKSERLVHLVTGSHDDAVSLEDFSNGTWEPFYGAMYLSLDGVSSEHMQAKDDIVYQFPRQDNAVIDARGMFITLAGTVDDATGSTIHSTTMMVDSSPVNVVYHCEGSDLFVISAPESRFTLPYLKLLVADLIRLLQLLHGSVHDAFSRATNHKQLDCFFALLHETRVSRSADSITVRDHSISQAVQILPVSREVKVLSDSALTEFEAADFGDMSDSYYGCRRSYSVLGSCLFFKNYLITNHLPKEDLVDVATYLKYHSLLSLSADQSIGQLVAWREVFPSRHCHSVGHEHTFGYTEPLVARWFSLIVGYKHMIMCIMLETGGCTTIRQEGIATPDPFLIDQARALLLHLDGQGLPRLCQNSLTSQECPPCANPDYFCHSKNKHGSLRRHINTSMSIETQSNTEITGTGTPSRVASSSRKDSLCSDNSSESSGSDSIFKLSRRGRLFPEVSESLQNITESEDIRGPINTRRKLTAGVENCLFCFQYFDNLDGVLISSHNDVSSGSQLTRELYDNFHNCCEKIKKLFDRARKIKVQRKDGKDHVFGLNKDLCAIREEGVMFTTRPSSDDKKSERLSYWVVGRCLSRSLRREVYVCFHEATPQTVIELAFKLAFGYLPV